MARRLVSTAAKKQRARKRTIRRGSTDTETDMPLFTVSSSSSSVLDERIREYIERPVVRAIRFQNRAYIVAGNQRCRGIHKALRTRFYPSFRKPARTRVHSGRLAVASSKAIGKLVDSQIERYLRAGCRAARRLNRFTRAIITYFEQQGEQLQACQLPVHLEGTQVATQGDHFTVSRTERNLEGKPLLTMWELKTGFSSGASLSQGHLAAPLQAVKSTQFNHFELQRQATHDGFVRAGLKVDRSFVLHVHARRADRASKTVHVIVDRLANASWLHRVNLLGEL